MSSITKIKLYCPDIELVDNSCDADIKLTSLNELIDLVYKDALTHAYNRRMLDRIDVDNKWILLADIDNLREVNKLSYTAGDLTICKVAEELIKIGTVIRLGGDEFLTICDSEPIINFNNVTGALIYNRQNTITMVIEMLDTKLRELKQRKGIIWNLTRDRMI